MLFSVATYSALINSGDKKSHTKNMKSAQKLREEWIGESKENNTAQISEMFGGKVETIDNVYDFMRSKKSPSEYLKINQK